MRPKLLDLFCGAGGAAAGYTLAGFDVTGVDASLQPRYPYRFIRGNALDIDLRGFDAIHASPPCQAYSVGSACRPHNSYPDLIGRIRERLQAAGVPYVLENVPRAPLINPVVLCGSHFSLSTYWPEKNIRVGLKRHRLFECSFDVPDPGPHDHSLPSLPVYGHSAGGNRTAMRGSGFAKATREVMGIGWMKRAELIEAIPPAFTEYVGKYLMGVIT